MRSEYSFPFFFSPCVFLSESASPLEQNRILGDTDPGELAEAAPPTSDASEGKLEAVRAVPTPSRPGRRTMTVTGPAADDLSTLVKRDFHTINRRELSTSAGL